MCEIQLDKRISCSLPSLLSVVFLPLLPSKDFFVHTDQFLGIRNTCVHVILYFTILTAALRFLLLLKIHSCQKHPSWLQKLASNILWPERAFSDVLTDVAVQSSQRVSPARKWEKPLTPSLRQVEVLRAMPLLQGKRTGRKKVWGNKSGWRLEYWTGREAKRNFT